MLERFEIQTLSEKEIAGAFTLREPAFVKAVALADGHEAVYETIECERVGRVFLEDLRPGTEYAVSFSADGEELSACSVKTLPAPQGMKRSEFSVIGDPHITTRREIRRGRLFVESAGILRQTIAEINKRETSFVLLPGDVTNEGYADEVALAGEVLDELECPLLTVPGDHDTAKGRRHIYDAFGPGQWVERRDGFTIIGCDVVNPGRDVPGIDEEGVGYCLGRKGADHILSALESADGPVILLCHRQLVPDDYVLDENRVIGDHELFAAEVLPRLPVGTIAYVGHKNLPAMYRRGNLLQLNVPQPVQYPCGTLRVRCYENGMYHTYVPMFSEVMNDFSRVAGSALGVNLWEENYRRGRGHHLWNFVFDPLTGRVIS